MHINLTQRTIKKHVYSFKKHLFPINPEDIVLALCPLIEKATQPHPSGKGMVPYQIGMCPRKDTCSLVMLRYSERRRIKFKYKTRYINPQKHFFACAFGNDNKHMLGLKEQALLEKYTNLSAAVMSSASASFNILSNNDYPCLNGRR